MPVKAENNELKSKRSLFKTIGKVVFRTALFLLAFVVIVSLSFIFLSQTSVFRGWFYGKVLELVNEELDGRIEAADIKISPFEGLKIQDLRILAAGDTLAHIKEITIRYSFAPIFDNYLNIKSITIENPKIKLIRLKSDSTWNFEHLIKQANDTSASGNSDWIFDVKNLTLINGKIKIDDDLAPAAIPNVFSLSHSDFKNINISLRAKADLRHNKYYAEINKFLMFEKNSNFDIREFSLHARLDSSGASLNNVHLRTNYARAKLNAKLTKINLLANPNKEALEQSHFDMEFNSEYISLSALNRFIAGFPKINEDIRLNGHLSGNVKRLVLDKFKLNKDNSAILFSGRATNLLDSNNLKYKISILNSDLYDDDFKEIKKAFELSYLNIGHTHIKRIEAEGGTKQINAKMDFTSPFAEMSGDAKINLRELPDYFARLKFKNVNPGYLLGDNSLNSDLSGEMELNGRGFVPKDIDADLSLSFNKSRFSGYRIDDLLLKTRVDSNLKIKIDTLLLALDNAYTDSLINKYSDKSKIMTSGRLDYSDAKMPQYSFLIELQEFNLASLLKSYLMPQYLDTKMLISGKGFHPDSLEININAAIDNCMFGNRALMPFNLDLAVERFFDNGRQILISSELFDVELNGEYKLEDFAYFAGMQVGELVSFIDRKVNKFNYTEQEADSLQFRFKRRKIDKFKNFTMDLTASLHDLTPIGIAVGQPYLSGNADIEAYIDAEDKRTVIDLHKLSINDFQYEDSQVKIVINPTEISTYLDLVLEDSLANFKKMDLSLVGKTSSFIDDMEFTKPYLYFNEHNDSILVDLDIAMNNFIRTKTKGNLLLKSGHFDLILDTTEIALGESYSWSSLEPIHLVLNEKGLTFDKFIFHRSDNEIIKMTGNANSTIANNIKIEAENFPLSQLSPFMSGVQKKFVSSLKGSLSSMVLTLNDSLLSPTFDCTFETSDLYTDKNYIGRMLGNLDYKDNLLQGGMRIIDSRSGRELLRTDVNSFPINLALKFGDKRILAGTPIDIRTSAKDVPLNIVNRFLPDDVSNLTGSANLQFNVVGERDNVEYTGYILAKDARLLARANNLYFNASGRINIHNEELTFDNVSIRNDRKDLRLSNATVSGSVLLDNFQIKHFDFNMKAKRLKLLGMASEKPMPGLFGDFVIGTRNDGINFSGSFEHPSLSGDMEIKFAHLFMPATEAKNYMATSGFKYKIKGNNLKIEEMPQDSLVELLFNAPKDTVITIHKQEKPKEIKQNKSFADLIKYDLNIWFFMPMQIDMALGGGLGKMTSIISTRIPSSSIHYFVDPDKQKAKIIGDLVLKKNSVFNYIKTFNITGDIAFPTGDIDNPRLNLKAEYNGKTSTRNYSVFLYIRGSQKRPILIFDYMIDNEPAKGDTAKIREDALFLLLTGMTKAEFKNSSNSSGGGFGDIGAQSLASAVASTITEMLSGTGFITGADIDLQGGSFQNAKLKLTGQVFGMNWKVGGNIADVMSGYEFTIEVPLGLLLFPDTFRSLFLTAMTSANPSQNISRNQKKWELKLKFGDEF